MSTSLILMIVCFLALMIIGLPIAYNLLITTVVYLLSADLNIVQLAIKMYGGMNSFSFLAVPFFVLTGQLMLRGGLLESLVKFVNVWFGNFKGAIAIVTIGASLLMGSIVGLAVASAASLGVFLIPMMKKEGYSPAYSAGGHVFGFAARPDHAAQRSDDPVLHGSRQHLDRRSVHGGGYPGYPHSPHAVHHCTPHREKARLPVLRQIHLEGKRPGDPQGSCPLCSCRSSSSAVSSAAYSPSPRPPALQLFTVRSSLSL